MKTSLTPEDVHRDFKSHELEDGGIFHTYRDDAGTVSSAVYHLYPGITLIRKDVDRPSFLANWRYRPERGLVIEHCWEGRLECQLGDHWRCFFLQAIAEEPTVVDICPHFLCGAAQGTESVQMLKENNFEQNHRIHTGAAVVCTVQ